jgi:peptidoglycan hydrolase CwlO-like protein
MHFDTEKQKDLNKQIEGHKARQADIAQGIHSSYSYCVIIAATVFNLLTYFIRVAMEKERLEAAEAERAIAEFSRKKESLMEHRQHLLKQIDETRQAIQKKRERIRRLFS